MTVVQETVPDTLAQIDGGSVLPTVADVDFPDAREYVGRHRDTASLYMRVVKKLGRMGASVLKYIREADAIVEAEHTQRQAEVSHRAAVADYDCYRENILP